jgi:hypothetical protein
MTSLTMNCSSCTAINAKVNDSDPRSVEEAAIILRQLKKPDSVAYKCGKLNRDELV